MRLSGIRRGLGEPKPRKNRPRRQIVSTAPRSSKIGLNVFQINLTLWAKLTSSVYYPYARAILAPSPAVFFGRGLIAPVDQRLQTINAFKAVVGRHHICSGRRKVKA